MYAMSFGLIFIALIYLLNSIIGITRREDSFGWWFMIYWLDLYKLGLIMEATVMLYYTTASISIIKSSYSFLLYKLSCGKIQILNEEENKQTQS